LFVFIVVFLLLVVPFYDFVWFPLRTFFICLSFFHQASISALLTLFPPSVKNNFLIVFFFLSF